MEDKELNKLSGLSPQSVPKKAKEKAVAAALQAFETAKNSDAVHVAEESGENIQKNFKENSQELFSLQRLIHSFNQKWRNTMSKPINRPVIVGTVTACTLVIAGSIFMFGQLPEINKEPIPDLSNLENKPTSEQIAKISPEVSPKKAPKNAPENAPEISNSDKESEANRKVEQITKSDVEEKGFVNQNPTTAATTTATPTEIKEKRQETVVITESVDIAAAANDAEMNRAATSAPVQSMQNLESYASQPAMTQNQTRSRHIAKSMVAPSMDAIAPPYRPIMPPEPRDPWPQPQTGQPGDKFEQITHNSVKKTSEQPVSTFSIDVDTASYSYVRKQLTNGVLPNQDAVRVEELINYFDYDYALPASAEIPFKPNVAVYPSPWNSHTKLLHIGIKGHAIDTATESVTKPQSNLVFLIDVSGSMNSRDKLPLLKNAFRMMVDGLGENDTVAIVTYAGQAGTVLEPTSVKDKGKIFNALQRLTSGGSTAGAQGIQQAYSLAEANFDKDKINRVILATDGDFNVGISDPKELKKYIERKRASGIYLTVLGFGQGNYNDALMQTLAQSGNGVAAYIDTLNEAHKVLVEEANSTLFTIAKDVKIQIEFNPNLVSEYRLIGYENRMLQRQDFNNDKVDAGEIGAGHTVTAIYEITPTNSPVKQIDELRYQNRLANSLATESNNDSVNRSTQEIEENANSSHSTEYAFVKMRYKLPHQSSSKLLQLPITRSYESTQLDKIAPELKFAASVAAFGQLLQGNTAIANFNYDDVIALALQGKGEDKFGYRSEFIQLVKLAKHAQRF